MTAFKTIALLLLISISIPSFAQTNNSGGDKAGEIFYLKRNLYGYHYQKKYDKAIETIDKILALDTLHEDEYNTLKGLLYHKKKDTLHAIKTYQYGIAKFPAFPYNYSGMGFIFLEKNDKSSLPYFLKAKQKFVSFRVPVQTAEEQTNSYFWYDSASVYSGLASAYMLYEKYDSAYFYFKKAFNLYPRDPYLVKMAECKYLLFDFNKASKLAQQTLDMEKTNTLAIHLKAEILWYYGKKDKAVKAYDDIIQYCEVFLKPAKSLIPTKSDTLMDQYNVRIKKYKAYLYAQRGYLKTKLNDSTAAVTDFNKSVQYDSMNVFLFNNRALFYSHFQKDSAKTFEEINKGIQLDSNKSFSLYYNRALFYYRNHQYQLGLDDCLKALANDSIGMDSYKPFTLLAEFYHALNNNSSALEAVHRAVEKGVLFPWPYYVRAKIELAQGDKEKGTSDLLLAEKYNYAEEFTEKIAHLKQQYNIVLPKK